MSPPETLSTTSTVSPLAARVSRLAIRASLFGVGGIVLLVFGSWLVVTAMSSGRISDDATELPDTEVVIVPGARIFSNGEPSLMVQGRTDGALELYRTDRVDHVLVSGDNRESHYNEPAVMRNTLVTAGVPAEAVSLDYAGLDTWDTCLRAAEQFGVTEAVVVTQRLHAKRTASLCRRAGIDVTVLAVQPPRQRRSTKVRTTIRELLASVKAVGDIVRTPSARHGGPYVGLTGSVDMPDGGHPPDWNWEKNSP